MRSAYDFTKHAAERSTHRVIPPMIAEIIIEYGESRDAGDGAVKYTLTKRSMSALRQTAGREIAKAIEAYRTRNAYVVAAGSRIITVAYGNRPIIH